MGKGGNFVLTSAVSGGYFLHFYVTVHSCNWVRGLTLLVRRFRLALRAVLGSGGNRGWFGVYDTSALQLPWTHRPSLWTLGVMVGRGRRNGVGGYEWV